MLIQSLIQTCTQSHRTLEYLGLAIYPVFTPNILVEGEEQSKKAKKKRNEGEVPLAPSNQTLELKR